jgi:hypothetical protein
VVVDTLVEGAVSSSLDARVGLWGPYWSDESTGVIIYVDNAIDLRMARTTNKGASWSDTLLGAGGALQVACWYDKETPGNSGTLVHVAWIDYDNNSVYYLTVDISDGSVGTKRTVDSTVTVDFGSSNNRIAITQTVSGNIIVAFSTQTEIECYKSSDNFATAGTDIADVFESATQEDWCLLFPAATADDNDACAVFWDRSSNLLTLKMYDDSADSWVEFATTIGGGVDDTTHMNMDGSVRHSDSKVLVTWHENDDYFADNVRTAELTVDDILTPAVTAKTNVVTNQAESAQVSIFINQQNDDVYVAYLKGGTWQDSVDVVYHISTDGMTSWGVEQSYSQATADDIRLVSAGRTVGSSGGRYQPAFYNDDLTDIFVNEELDLELGVAAVSGAAVMSGEGSMSAVAAMVLSGSAALIGVGAVVAAGNIGSILTGAAVMSGVGSLTPGTPALTYAGQVSFSGEGSLAAVGERGALGAAVLSGVGSMAAIGEIGGTLEGRAVLSGVGSMSAVAERIVTGQAVLTGVGSMTPLGVLVVVGAAALAGVGSLTALGESGAIVYTQLGNRVTEWDAAIDYPPDTLFFFEATLEVLSGVNKTAAARLYNVTDAGEVTGSEVLIPGPGPSWQRSSSFSLPAGVKRYRIEYGGTSGGIYKPHGAAVRAVSA